MNRQEPAPQLGLFVDGEGPVPVTRFTGDWGPLAYLDATLAALPYRLLPDPPPARPPARSGRRHRPAPRPAPRRRAHRRRRAGRQRGRPARRRARGLRRPDPRPTRGAAARRHGTPVHGRRPSASRPDRPAPAPAGGRSTLAESFATTVEAFTGYLQGLAPDGLLALPHPLRLPPRDSLKLVLTALEALERLGAAEPARHLVLVRSWDSVLLLVRRTPFPDAGAGHGRRASPRRSPSTSAGTRAWPARPPTGSTSWASRCSSTASPR